jgi:hypothetical protein
MTPTTVKEWIAQQDDPAKWTSIYAMINQQWLLRADQYPKVSLTTLWNEFLDDLDAYLAQKEKKS